MVVTYHYYGEKDENGNVVMEGMHFGINTTGTLISSNNPHRLTATIGVKDLIIVDTGDALLICNRSQVQKVRQIVNYLKETDRKELW